MKIQTLIEIGKSVDFTIISNVSRKMEGHQRDIKIEELEFSSTHSHYKNTHKTTEKQVLVNHNQVKHNSPGIWSNILKDDISQISACKQTNDNL